MSRSYTRREKACLRLGILGALLVIGAVTGLYQVLPSMAVQDLEIGYGIAPTATIDRVYTPELSQNRLCYLRENEDVLLFASVEYHPFLGGWQRRFATVMPREVSAPVQAGFVFDSNDDQRITYVFGLVNQPGEVVLQARDWVDDTVLSEYVVPETAYRIHDGNTYFLSEVTDFYNQEQWMSYYPKFVYHLRTPQGEVIGQGRLDWA